MSRRALGLPRFLEPRDAQEARARADAEKWGDRAADAMRCGDRERAMRAGFLAAHYGRKCQALEEVSPGPARYATFTTFGTFLNGQGRKPAR